MRGIVPGLALVCSLSFLPSAVAAGEARRFCLVAGANHGGPERVALRYAIADAERFASVLVQLGGVAQDDCVILRDPTRADFLDALGRMGDHAWTAKRTGARVEVLLYYSGHADERGLMLGTEALSYGEIRTAVQRMAADVGITVLDACGSGVITRLKGGTIRPPFLTDESMRMQGRAFLTSSSENEAAQESERLQGSFFTHALVSGLRGAADTSGDGRVTLGEAYQFAYQETLAQTTATQGGAQHPAYDIRMSGTGDVVITDVRQASAGLVLPADIEGRFFVRDAKQRLVVELYKTSGRIAEIAVAPGAYLVQYEAAGKQLYDCTLTVEDGHRRTFGRQDLAPAGRMATRLRGPVSGGEARSFVLNGRNRVEFESGGGLSALAGSFFRLRLGFVRWLGEDVALEGAVTATFPGGHTATAGPQIYVDIDPHTIPYALTDTYTSTDRSLGLSFGARYYVPLSGRARRLRPFLGARLGPVAEHQIEHRPEGDFGHSAGAVEGWLGVGLDYQFGRRFSLVAHVGWDLRTERKPQARFGLALGFGFGGARRR